MSEDALAWLLCGPAAILGTWAGLELAYSETVQRHVNSLVVIVRRLVK
jgi:hypothetical protein